MCKVGGTQKYNGLLPVISVPKKDESKYFDKLLKGPLVQERQLQKPLNFGGGENSTFIQVPGSSNPNQSLDSDFIRPKSIYPDREGALSIHPLAPVFFRPDPVDSNTKGFFVTHRSPSPSILSFHSMSLDTKKSLITHRSPAQSFFWPQYTCPDREGALSNHHNDAPGLSTHDLPNLLLERRSRVAFEDPRKLICEEESLLSYYQKLERIPSATNTTYRKQLSFDNNKTHRPSTACEGTKYHL